MPKSALPNKVSALGKGTAEIVRVSTGVTSSVSDKL